MAPNAGSPGTDPDHPDHMKELYGLRMDIRIGDRVRIRDNGWITTHITPRWSYFHHGTVVRLNDLSVTVELDDYDHERIRVDYDDVEVQR